MSGLGDMLSAFGSSVLRNHGGFLKDEVTKVNPYSNTARREVSNSPSYMMEDHNIPNFKIVGTMLTV